MAKIKVTFSVDEDVKKDFNIECIEHGINMSDTVENMMKNFCNASKQMKEELLKSSAQPKTIEVVDSTRLELKDE